MNRTREVGTARLYTLLKDLELETIEIPLLDLFINCFKKDNGVTYLAIKKPAYIGVSELDKPSNRHLAWL